MLLGFKSHVSIHAASRLPWNVVRITHLRRASSERCLDYIVGQEHARGKYCEKGGSVEGGEGEEQFTEHAVMLAYRVLDRLNQQYEM